MRKSHLVLPDPERYGVAVALCRQFETARPFRWDSWKRASGECQNCNRIKKARGLGMVKMTASPDYPGITVQIGGWTFSGGYSW